MTIKEIKEIIISALKDEWIITDDNDYYINQLRESTKDDLEATLSDIEANTIQGIEYVRDMQDELSSIQ